MKIIILKPRNLKYAITGLKILVKTLGSRLYPKSKQVNSKLTLEIPKKT